jgi:hypothetical protein
MNRYTTRSRAGIRIAVVLVRLIEVLEEVAISWLDTTTVDYE